MKIDRLEMARARLAVHRATGQYLFDRARRINLIDIAQYVIDGKPESRLAIRFHVDEKIPDVHLQAMGREPLQRQQILDFPSMVVEGKYHTHQWIWWGGRWWPRLNPRTARADPLKGGVSISTMYYGSGTLGGIVQDRTTHQPMILSNWHVLAVYWSASRGQPILQPGRNDGGTQADVIATLERSAMSENLDAAVAALTGNRQLSNEQIGLGAISGVGPANLGIDVEKSGRSSGLTFGRVTGIGGVLRLQYGWLERLIREVITIEPRIGGEVSRGGDSGSWWLNSATNQAVGLHFAGSNRPERALALDMQTVLDTLNVNIFT